jgi:hypothetical protein
MVYDLLSDDGIKFSEKAFGSLFDFVFVILQQLVSNRQHSFGKVHALLVVDILVVIENVYQLVN